VSEREHILTNTDSMSAVNTLWAVRYLNVSAYS